MGGRRVRVVTWNMKQAVAPRRALPELWDWLEQRVDPTIAVLTEAKVPASGPPPGWTALWRPEGIGSRRRWGTVIAARAGVEITPVDAVRKNGPGVDELWPGTVCVADVRIGGELWGTVVGLYGLTIDAAGTGLIDLTDVTSAAREPGGGCADCRQPCTHLWTHRNGNSPNAARQQLDFIFANTRLANELVGVGGGVEEFADAWEVSDHAPLTADFDVWPTGAVRTPAFELPVLEGERQRTLVRRRAPRPNGG